MWTLFRGRGQGMHCFQQMGVVEKGEQGCVHVCLRLLSGASWGCFFSVCQLANSLLIWVAKMTGHSAVFARLLSPYPIYPSTHLSSFFPLYLTSFTCCLFVFSLVTESIATWCTALIVNVKENWLLLSVYERVEMGWCECVYFCRESKLKPGNSVQYHLFVQWWFADCPVHFCIPL